MRKQLRWMTCGLLVAGTLANATCAAPGPRGSGQREIARPRLVVFIVVDQLPSWSFAQRVPYFSHGYARLLREGTYVPRVELPTALPFTAPGHATLATGVVAAEHGIVGNSWFRREVGMEQPAEWDPAASVLRTDGGGPTPDVASGAALQVAGVGDWLRAQRPGAHALAIGLKSRAACFVAGQAPELAIFFEPEAGGMTTSTAYAPQVPAWLQAHNARHAYTRYLNATWRPLDVAHLARVTGAPDAQRGELNQPAGANVFPHAVGASVAALTASPFGDDLVFETALAARAALRLGEDDIPDLLALSLNAHDYVGHSWGQESWEAWDFALQQDRKLGAFMAALDRTVGLGQYAIVLTSDHGATPLVERAHVAGARRISSQELKAAAERGLAQVAGPGSWVRHLASLNLYLSDAWLALPAETQAAGLTAAVAELRRVPGVAFAATTAQLARSPWGECPRASGLPALLCFALPAARAGELVVALAPGVLVSDYASGTHHDAASDDNRFVPLLLWGAGAQPRLPPNPTTLMVAPTLATLLGLAVPRGRACSLAR